MLESLLPRSQRPAAPPDDNPRVSPRAAERALQLELFDEFRTYMQTMTAAAARLAGRVVNEVLAVKLATIPAGPNPPVVSDNFHVAAGSIYVRNLGTHPMTVHANGPGDAAPTGGVGVWIVPANTADTIAIASRQVSIYGTAGDQVEYQAFTGAVDPVA